MLEIILYLVERIHLFMGKSQRIVTICQQIFKECHVYFLEVLITLIIEFPNTILAISLLLNF